MCGWLNLANAKLKMKSANPWFYENDGRKCMVFEYFLQQMWRYWSNLMLPFNVLFPILNSRLPGRQQKENYWAASYKKEIKGLDHS